MRLHRPRRLGAAFAVLAPALGCAHAPSSPAPPVAPPPAAASPAAPAPLVEETLRLGTSREGRSLEAWTLTPSAPEETVLVLATIHGDEAAGTPLVERLRERVRAEPELLGARRLVLVPVANPDGYVAGRRGNARGVDLNRNFPSANFRGRRRHGEEPLSEPESRALHALVERERPDRVVSVHQPLACVDYDGPGAALAEALAAACRLPVRRLGGRPGSLGSWVGQDLGRPIVTLELPRGAAADVDALWARYGPALLAALAPPRAPAAD